MEKTESYWQGVLSSYIGRDLPEVTPRQHYIESTCLGWQRVEFRREYSKGRKHAFSNLRQFAIDISPELLQTLERNAKTNHSRFGFFQVFDYVDLDRTGCFVFLQDLLQYPKQVLLIQFFKPFHFDDYLLANGGEFQLGAAKLDLKEILNKYCVERSALRVFVRSYKNRIE